MTVVKEHVEAGMEDTFTIIIPSLGRERQTIAERLNFDVAAMATLQSQAAAAEEAAGGDDEKEAAEGAAPAEETKG